MGFTGCHMVEVDFLSEGVEFFFLDFDCEIFLVGGCICSLIFRVGIGALFFKKNSCAVQKVIPVKKKLIMKLSEKKIPKCFKNSTPSK
jgi:hypothetical protein